MAAVADQAHGGLEAQKVVDGLRDGSMSVDSAWFKFVQLAARHGWRSVACRAFIAELAKRAAAL